MRDAKFASCFILHQEKVCVYGFYGRIYILFPDNYLTKRALMMYFFKSKGDDEDSSYSLKISESWRRCEPVLVEG